MSAMLKSPFAWLLRREYWESRRGFLWAQVSAMAVVLAITVLGIIAGEVFRARVGGSVDMGGNLNDLLRAASAHDIAGVARGLDAVLVLLGSIASLVLFFVVFFYLLGALYDDRRDRSILFWKSLPVSDTRTVIAKVIAALLMAPVIATLVVLAGYMALQLILSVWFLAHGVNPFGLLWLHAEPFSLWLSFLVMVPVDAIWALPTAGWLLLWSSAVRSKPFLWAVLIPLVAGLLNAWIALLGLPHIGAELLWRQVIGRALLGGLMPGGWLPPDAVTRAAAGAASPTAEIYAAMGHALAQPGMWIGAAAGIAMIAIAIWFRRWRDET